MVYCCKGQLPIDWINYFKKRSVPFDRSNRIFTTTYNNKFCEFVVHFGFVDIVRRCVRNERIQTKRRYAKNFWFDRCSANTKCLHFGSKKTANENILCCYHCWLPPTNILYVFLYYLTKHLKCYTSYSSVHATDLHTSFISIFGNAVQSCDEAVLNCFEIYKHS